VLRAVRDFYTTSRGDAFFWALKAVAAGFFVARLAVFQSKPVAEMFSRGHWGDLQNLFAYAVILGSLVALRRAGVVALLLVQWFQLYGAWTWADRAEAGVDAVAINTTIDQFMFSIAVLAVMIGAYQYYADERII